MIIMNAMTAVPQSGDAHSGQLIQIFSDFSANIIGALVDIGHAAQTTVTHLVGVAVILDATRAAVTLIPPVEIVRSERYICNSIQF